MLGPIYGDPKLLEKITLEPGSVVEHTYKPGTPLVVVSGPTHGVTDDVYRVMLDGREVPVKRKNLII